MGQRLSNVPGEATVKPKRERFIKSLKKLTKYGMKKKRRKPKKEKNLPNVSSALPLFQDNITNGNNVIVPTLDLITNEGNDTNIFIKHSLLSYALSKLAIFTGRSRSKLSSKASFGEKNSHKKNLNFNNDHEDKSAQVSPKGSTETQALVLEGSNRTSISNGNEISGPKASGALVRNSQKLPGKNTKVDLGSGDANTNKISEEDLDENGNRISKEDLAKKLLASVSAQTVKTPEELYTQNLQKFEALLALTATTTSSEEEADKVDENKNIIVKKESGKLPKRIISTSKNRVEVDVYFMDWVKRKMSKESSESGSGSGSDEDDDDEGESSSSELELENGKGGKSKGGLKSHTKTNYTKSGSGKASAYASKSKHPTNPSKSKHPTNSKNDSKKACKDNYLSCVKRGQCAGKAALSGAPPAYLDYGCTQTYPGAACRKSRDPMIDRLKNVDVVEQLTYMVPTDPCCEDEGCEEDECDYYAVCESCGEMEPVPPELAKTLKGRKKKCKTSETTPVTYTRRQRFNLKNNDDDEDGPPFKYDGTQGRSCRCPCCVAGLRRNPNCGCKCCLVMGNSRRVNSFDEIPVGKNPQIRRIPCPVEEYENMLAECDKYLPEVSGLYKFDPCETQFERQVPRTPTPIVIEVPAPRGLKQEDLLDIAAGLTKMKKEEDECCDCADPCVMLCEPDPIYLPPVYGQFNACGPPCCQNETDENSNKKGKKKNTARSYTATKYGTGAYSTKQGSYSYRSGQSYGTQTGSGEPQDSESTSDLPSLDLEADDQSIKS